MLNVKKNYEDEISSLKEELHAIQKETATIPIVSSSPPLIEREECEVSLD